MKHFGTTLVLAAVVAALTPAVASAGNGDLSTVAKVNGCRGLNALSPQWVGPVVVGEKVGHINRYGSYMSVNLAHGSPGTVYTVRICRNGGGPFTAGTFKTRLLGSGYWSGYVGYAAYFEVAVVAAGPGALGSAVGYLYGF